MLGLGNSLVTGGVLTFTPKSLANLTLWLAFNQHITADQNTDGDSISHSTTDGNMADGDKINAWNGYGGTSINAVQTTESDKPLWETDAADVGGVNFANNNKIMDLSANVVLDANTDFTIAIRFKCVDFTKGGLMGSATNEFLKFRDNTELRLKITDGGSTNDRDFALASGNMATDEYFTIVIVRSDGSTGNINVYIRGNESLTTTNGIQMGSQLTDAGEITISDIGVTHDEGGNFKGFFKDVLIWDGTAASDAYVKDIFDYLENQ